MDSPKCSSDSYNLAAGTSSDNDSPRTPFAANETLRLLHSDDLSSKIEAAKQIRRLSKTSQRNRRHFSSAIPRLVDMLRSDSVESAESALLALLNLAVKDEKNKVSIVDAGALEPIVSFLHSESNMHEHATATLLTLSAASVNKPAIVASGVIPFLADILRDGSPQAKIDALMALYNLSTHPDYCKLIIRAEPVPSIVNLLKTCKKSSKLAEKCSALIESLVEFEEARTALTSEEGGVLAIIEVLESGSLQSREHALGTLLTMCQIDKFIIRAEPVPSIVNLLKTCKKSSKLAEKCSALIESLVEFEEARTALTSEEGGVLAIVEVLESGSLQSREHALGTLLTMCQIDRCRYREPILREGVIPGLLELTVLGSERSQFKAQTLLRLLRDSPYPRTDIQPETLENIVCNLISQIDVDEQSGKAKQMLTEMVQISMEQSLKHLQQRAMVCTPADLPITSCASEVSLK